MLSERNADPNNRAEQQVTELISVGSEESHSRKSYHLHWTSLVRSRTGELRFTQKISNHLKYTKYTKFSSL